jgi:hypothetical protein
MHQSLWRWPDPEWRAPATLAVQQVLELIICFTTAKSLDVTVPAILLARADKVAE